MSSDKGVRPAICDGVTNMPDPMHEIVATIMNPYRVSSSAG